MDTINITKLVTMTIDEIEKADSCCLFYDWFCRDSSIKGKSKKLMGTVRSIFKANRESRKFDPDKWTVFFKNNCPCWGSLYDTICLYEIDGDDEIVIAPMHEGVCELHYNVGGTSVEGKFKSMKELVSFFKAI